MHPSFLRIPVCFTDGMRASRALEFDASTARAITWVLSFALLAALVDDEAAFLNEYLPRFTPERRGR